MRKFFNLFILIFVAIVFLSCGSSTYYQSAYQNKEFKLNELNKDWSGMTYSSIDQGMVYGITNDDEYLYAKLKVVDKRNQRKIVMNGLILWFDIEGKSKKKLGYAFPLINEDARKENDLANLNQNDPVLRERLQAIQIEPSKVNRRFKSGKEAINIISKDGELKESLPSHRNENGINMMVYMDEYHILYYEAKIPLNKIFGDFKKGDVSNIPAFSYGFEVGELELGVKEYLYMRSPSMMRSVQMIGGGGMYGQNQMSATSGQQMYGVKRIHDKAVQVWVKQAKLGSK